ncbi:MAG: signal peptide peptidase SppA [Sedimentisphaerales bacterium]|nr:signal peptide peptidase SppA [Sedimentisphaerales bacterium]
MKIKKNSIWFIIILLMVFLTGCGPSAYLVRPVPAGQKLQEAVIRRDPGWFIFDKIAIVDVDGMMTNQQQAGLFSTGENPVSLFVEKLDKAQDDDDVRAVVLRINSPGGTVAASDCMYHRLREFKEKTDKPVVACMLDVAASGGYYLACGSDYIMATPGTVTGSIGTILQTISFKGTMDIIGMDALAIKSGQLKDIGSPLKKREAGEIELLEGIIMQFYEQFLEVVLQGRVNLKEDKLRELADGRVFTASQALEEGLIDQIGYPDDAIRWARKKAGIERAKVVIYQRPVNYKPNVYGSALNDVRPGALVNLQLPDWLQGHGPQFLYMWNPSLD